MAFWRRSENLGCFKFGNHFMPHRVFGAGVEEPRTRTLPPTSPVHAKSTPVGLAAFPPSAWNVRHWSCNSPTEALTTVLGFWVRPNYYRDLRSLIVLVNFDAFAATPSQPDEHHIRTARRRHIGLTACLHSQRTLALSFAAFYCAAWRPTVLQTSCERFRNKLNKPACATFCRPFRLQIEIRQRRRWN